MTDSGQRERVDADDQHSPENLVPSEGAVVRDRFSSDEIFQRIIAAADEEVTSTRRELFFSAVAAGFAISITFLMLASLTASTESPVLQVLLYPIGFIYIIIGGYQLYTENTLPPVALTLERFASVTGLLRHWLIVLTGNFAGGAFGAIVLAWGGVFSPDAAIAAEELAYKGIKAAPMDLFFKGMFAGLIVAGVVWVEYASRDTISRLVVIYLAFLCIPLGNLFHVVVSFTELIYLLLVGYKGVSFVAGMTGFVIPVMLGNTLGGILLVTVVNYYQTSERRLGRISDQTRINRLSTKEWIFGKYAGRSYVPLLEHHDHDPARDEEGYQVLVPISNPRTEENLVRLAAVLASQHERGTVHLLHTVQLPRERSFQYNTRQRERIREASNRQLDPLRQGLTEFDVEVETSTIVSYRSFLEVFNQAKQERADLVVMGWEPDRHWDTLYAGRPIEELTSGLPCDFLVLKDRDLDTSRVLLPTAGGPDSALSATVAKALNDEFGSNISLLHVVDPGETDAGQSFIEKWAKKTGIEEYESIVDDSGDVEGAIERAATDHTLLLIGATERGMLTRLATDSLHLDVVNEVDCSVLLAERPHDRSLFQRLFGRGQRDAAESKSETTNP